MQSMENIVESRSSETDHAVLHENFTILESVQRRILLKKPNKGRQATLLSYFFSSHHFGASLKASQILSNHQSYINFDPKRESFTHA